MTSKLGVFYTCFTEKKAVEYSLEELYKHYPNIPVYLVSDGGSDYTFLKEKFPDKKLETKLEEDTRGIIAVIDRKCASNVAPCNAPGYYLKENKEKMLHSIDVFLKRINDAIDYCNSEYLLIMEPDVLVRGKINIREGSKLLGSRVNQGLNFVPQTLLDYMDNYEGAIKVRGWGCTPAIFKTSEFKKILDLLKKDTGLIERVYHMNKNLPYYDALLSILFGFIGVEEEFNPDITECCRNPNWKNSAHSLLHQFRKYYPSKKDHYQLF